MESNCISLLRLHSHYNVIICYVDNFVPDDPMWFEDDAGEDGGEEKSFR